MTQNTCNRCKHSWWQRTPESPRSCPKCKSPYWNKARIRTTKYVCSLLGGEEHKQDNAQAIAALPDLIEALQQLADEKGECYWSHAEILQIARNALAKAGIK